MFGKKPTPTEARHAMVKNQLAKRAISDRRILQAMADIPRHWFVHEKYRHVAYEDRPLPIGYGQTISQPYIVAFMLQSLALTPDTVVLEVGTGSGYQTALLSRLVARVYTVERIAPLAAHAEHIIQALNITNVVFQVSDGGYGWSDHAPYDRIIVAAAPPEIPAPLIAQLKEGGVLIIPAGQRRHQELFHIQRQGDNISKTSLVPVAFVPLIGEHGWESDS